MKLYQKEHSHKTQNTHSLTYTLVNPLFVNIIYCGFLKRKITVYSITVYKGDYYMRTGRPSSINIKNQNLMHKMYKENNTIKNIASYFNCTTWTVRNELKKAKASPRFNCKVCSKPLIGNRNILFCSNHCVQTFRRKYRNCKICDKELVRKDTDKNVKYCDECSSNLTYQTCSDIKNKRKKILIDLKGGKCIYCGYKKCINALEFHHVDKSKKRFNLSGGNISSRKWKDVLDESKKCDLVCSNCHREQEIPYFKSLQIPIGKRAMDL